MTLASATRAVLRRTGRSLERTQQRLRLPYLKTATLMVVITAMFASQADVLFANPGVFLALIPPIMTFFAAAFVVALGVGRLLGLRYPEAALLVFTTTSRNSEASLAIAATAFASPLVALTVVIGPSIELPLLVVMVRLLLHLRRRGLFAADQATGAADQAAGAGDSDPAPGVTWRPRRPPAG